MTHWQKRPPPARRAIAHIHRLRGELTARLPHPDPAKAEDSFRTALAVFREQGARGYELRAATSLARAVRRHSRESTPDLIRGAFAGATNRFAEAAPSQPLKVGPRSGAVQAARSSL
jgi:predicted ATPase